MKKALLTLAILFTCISANAQWFPFKDVNIGHFGMGIHGGVLGLGKEVTRAAFGANALVYGVYLDVLFNEPEHLHVPKPEVWKDDTQAFSIHIGYQIPILEYLRIIPIVGYAEVSKGDTDGTAFTVGYSNNTNRWGVRNFFTKKWSDGSFNAGGSVVANLGPVNVFVTGTMCSVYGGLGLEF